MKRNLVLLSSIIIFMFTAIACKDPLRPPTLPPDLSDSESYTLLALGDSYTIGQSVATEERWPNQLAQQLRTSKHKLQEPVILARTGWTTTNLIQALESPSLNPPYDVVTLLIGVNDQYQGKSLDSYRQGFSYLLHQAIKLANRDSSRVIVLSIPDYSVTPFAKYNNPERIRKELDQFNTLNQQLALAAGVSYVDITPISRLAATDPSWLAPDELHPSGKMYAEWVKLILPIVEEILAKQSQS